MEDDHQERSNGDYDELMGGSGAAFTDPKCSNLNLSDGCMLITSSLVDMELPGDLDQPLPP